MYVRAGRPAFARPCVGVHKSTSLMSSSLLLQPHTYTNICGNIINNNDDFNERTNILLHKNISLAIYSRKGWCWFCVRGESETETDCYILTQVLLTIAELVSHLGWGCSTVGHWGPKALCLPLALTSASCIQLTPTGSNHLEHLLI